MQLNKVHAEHGESQNCKREGQDWPSAPPASCSRITISSTRCLQSPTVLDPFMKASYQVGKNLQWHFRIWQSSPRSCKLEGLTIEGLN